MSIMAFKEQFSHRCEMYKAMFTVKIRLKLVFQLAEEVIADSFTVHLEYITVHLEYIWSILDGESSN